MCQPKGLLYYSVFKVVLVVYRPRHDISTAKKEGIYLPAAWRVRTRRGDRIFYWRELSHRKGEPGKSRSRATFALGGFSPPKPPKDVTDESKPFRARLALLARLKREWYIRRFIENPGQSCKVDEVLRLGPVPTILIQVTTQVHLRGMSKQCF